MSLEGFRSSPRVDRHGFVPRRNFAYREDMKQPKNGHPQNERANASVENGRIRQELPSASILVPESASRLYSNGNGNVRIEHVIVDAGFGRKVNAIRLIPVVKTGHTSRPSQ